MILAAVWGVAFALPPPAQGELRIRDICRVKGQEEGALHGLGLVVGLNGSGGGSVPTTRALAKMMELMGSPLTADNTGRPVLKELEDARNVALVFVSATVPEGGGRQGDCLNCSVNAIGAKSLEGGFLMLTPLLGSRPGDPRIHAYAQGPLTVEKSGAPTTGRIHRGARLVNDFRNTFVEEGTITLVLDKNHAGFQTAHEIQDTLNSPRTFGTFTGRSPSEGLSRPNAPLAGLIAQAIDQVNIVVRVPEAYRENPVQFASEVLDTRILTPENDARVVINERNGVIIIGDSVEIGPVAVSHKNLSIQTGAHTANGPLLVVSPPENTSTTKLRALVDALNALKVNSNDIIDIIKQLERSGDLFGHVIIE
jgi:flagellar P-ring protein precursor FlgI